MRARARLHLGALLIALLAPLGWALLLWRDRLAVGDLRLLAFAVPGIIAAQMAAWMRWRALERRAGAGRHGWPAGLGMAALTHLLFGLLVALGLVVAVGPRAWLADASPWMLVPQALFFSLMSLGACGLVTFLATALLAQHVAHRRGRELAHDPS